MKYYRVAWGGGAAWAREDGARLLWFVSRVMTLLPGDIISTGTPAGIGPIEAGDVVEVELEGVGILRNVVVSEERAVT